MLPQDEDDSEPLPENAPVLLMAAGIAGGSHDTYVKHFGHMARQRGIRPVGFNSRGTAGGPLTTAQFYSASYTE